MKRLASVLLIALILVFCVGCGAKSEYVGTYTRNGESATYTVTLTKNGEFKFERKYKNPKPYDPTNKDNYNIRKGTYSIENDKIIIDYSYYDDALRDTVYGTASARLDGDKLIISEDAEIGGTYARK